MGALHFTLKVLGKKTQRSFPKDSLKRFLGRLQELGSLGPFRGAIQPECEKVRSKCRNGFPAPRGPGRPKSPKRVKNEVISLGKVSFELVFTSFGTFWPRGARRPWEPISRLISDFRAFGLSCPSEWSLGAKPTLEAPKPVIECW